MSSVAARPRYRPPRWPRRASPAAARPCAQTPSPAIRARRLAVLAVVARVSGLTVLMTAFGGAKLDRHADACERIAASFRPARRRHRCSRGRATLHIQLPVPEPRHRARLPGGGAGALALVPVGSQANEGLLPRLLHKAVGGGSSLPRWYQLPGGHAGHLRARRRRCARNRRLLAGRRDDRRHQRLGRRRPRRRPADRHPADAGPVARRLGLALLRTVAAARSPPLLVGATLEARAGSRSSADPRSLACRAQARARYTNDEGNHVLRSRSIRREPGGP